MIRIERGNISRPLVYKKLYALSEILSTFGETVNFLYAQRKSQMGIIEEFIYQDFEDLKKEIRSKKLKIIINQNSTKNLVEILRALRDLQIKLAHQNKSKEKILFNHFLKIQNYKCNIEEKLLFSLYADKNQNLNMKFPFINKINLILNKPDSKNVEPEEIRNYINYNKDFDINLEKYDEEILSYLSLKDLDGEK